MRVPCAAEIRLFLYTRDFNRFARTIKSILPSAGIPWRAVTAVRTRRPRFGRGDRARGNPKRPNRTDTLLFFFSFFFPERCTVEIGRKRPLTFLLAASVPNGFRCCVTGHASISIVSKRERESCPMVAARFQRNGSSASVYGDRRDSCPAAVHTAKRFGTM